LLLICSLFGTFTVTLSLLAPGFMGRVTTDGTSKFVNVSVRICLAAGHLVIALAALVLLVCAVALLIPVPAAAAVSVLVRSAAVPVPVTTASTPTAEPKLVPTIVIELVLVAIITLIESCLEARVKRAIITIAHARSAWMIVIILADIP